MKASSVIKELEYVRPGYFPQEELEEALAEYERYRPELLRMLKFATENGDDLHDDYIGHLLALLIFGQLRDQEVMSEILTLCRHPRAEENLGDLSTETLHRVLAACAGERIDELKRLIEDAAVDVWMRCAGLRALVCLVAWGEYDRGELTAYLKARLNAADADEDQVFVSETAHLCLDLHPGECEAEIRRVFDAGLVDQSYVTPKELALQLRKTPAKVLTELANNSYYEPILDVVAELEGWDCFKGGDEDYGLDDDYLAEDDPDYRSELAGDSFSEGEKIGRNETCPCGSGKKYKKCCGR